MGYHRKHAIDRILHVSFDFKDLRLWRAVFCEFFGTFLMVFVGLANVIASESIAEIDNLLTPGLTFAAIILTMIHIIGPTSGCHINPSVTIAMMAIRRCAVIKGLLYILAQLVGAIAGAALLYGVAPRTWVDSQVLGTNKLHPDLNMGQGLVVEIIGTMIMVLMVLVISDPDPKKDFEGFPSLSAGFAVIACVYFMAPYSGCSLNPARSHRRIFAH